MAASTCSAWTSWATSNWTAAARNCSSMCSPNGKRRHRSRSLPTQRSASGPAPSPTHACAPRSSTGSPSTPTSSRPAATPTDSRPPARSSRKPPQQALHGTVHSRHHWTATKRGGHHGHTPHQPADLRPRRHQHRNRQGQLPPDRHPAQPLPRLPHHRQPNHPQRTARIPHRQGTLTPHRGRLVHRHAQPQGPQRQHLPRPHPHHHTLTPDWPTARWGHFKLLHRGQLRLTQPRLATRRGARRSGLLHPRRRGVRQHQRPGMGLRRPGRLPRGSRHRPYRRARHRRRRGRPGARARPPRRAAHQRDRSLRPARPPVTLPRRPRRRRRGPGRRDRRLHPYPGTRPAPIREDRAMYPVTLTGRAVTLREFRRDDAAAAFSVVGDEDVTRWLSFDARDRDSTQAMIDGALERAEITPRTEYYLAVTLPDDELIGFARLGLSGVQAAQLGYAIRRDLWGHGYATDATRTLVDFGFRQLG